MSNEEKKPVAWARKWYIDGEKPYKVKDEKTNRTALHRKFKFFPTSAHKLFQDDVPLFTANDSNP